MKAVRVLALLGMLLPAVARARRFAIPADG
jgi:hypothetical protein